MRCYTATEIKLSLITWKIGHGPHRFPLERKISLQHFVTDNNFQDEIFRAFGEETLMQVLEVILGKKDYLQRLPPILLKHILTNLDKKDIMRFSEVSELCREAVKNTMSLLDVHQKSFNNMKIRKYGQRKLYKSPGSKMLSIINDCITKSNTNCSKFDTRKCVPDSSLSITSTRILNNAINNIEPLKRNTNTNRLAVNLTNPKSTFSIHGNIKFIPKFESLTPALLPISTTRTNNKAILKNNYNKESKKYSVVIGKDKDTETLKPSNKTKIQTDSGRKLFEVSSIMPENVVDKNRDEACISKPLSYKCVKSLEIKCARNFQSNTPSTESNKRGTNKMSKCTGKKIQSSGLGDGDKTTLLTHCIHDSKSDIKKKNVGSSKKLRDHQDKKA